MEAEPLAPLDLPTPADAEMRIDYGDDLDDAEMVEAQPAALGQVEAAVAETLEEAVMDDATEQTEGEAEVMEVVEDGTTIDTSVHQAAAVEEDPEAEMTSSATVEALTESAIVEVPSSAYIKDDDGSAGTLPDEATSTALPPVPSLARALSTESVPTIKVHSPLQPGAVDVGEDLKANKDNESDPIRRGPSANGHSVEEERAKSPEAEVDAVVTTEGLEDAGGAPETTAVDAQRPDEAAAAAAAEDDGSVEIVGKDQSTQAQQEQSNEDDQFVEVINITEECPTCSTLSKSIRPSLDKSLLSLIELPPVSSPTTDDPTTITAPTVLLTYQNQMYSVFRRLEQAAEEIDVALDSSLPVLFEQADKHELYFDQVERFIEALHGLFPELESGEDEILLELPEIGITLPEDNVYTRQVSLEVLHRVHVGCGLQGSLQLQLTSQPRFSSGFNALARHIYNSLGKDVDFDATGELEQDDDPTTEATSLEDERKDEQTNKDDGLEEQRENGTDGPLDEAELGISGEDEHYEDGGWHDEDVGYEGAVEAEGDDTAEDAVGTEEEEHDLEEALADMDSEDLNAYIEGAREDFVVSEEALEHDGGEAELGQDQEVEEVLLEEAPNTETGDGAVVEEEDEQPSAPPAEGLSSASAADPTDSTLSAPVIASQDPATPVVISYDTPLGTGDELPSVPLDSLSAVVDAAAASSKLAPSPLGQTYGTIEGDSSAGTTSEAEPAIDVVIDYEEVEEPTEATTAPVPDPADPPRSPKRAREDLEGEVPEIGDESVAGDSKRPRLSDPLVGSAPASA